MSFVERHGLWSNEQQEAAARLRSIVDEQKLEVIRLSFPDQHGILRGKTLVASEALASLESGCSITTTMLAKDTSHRTVFPVFTSGGGFGMKEMEGAADVLMVADPTTFRVLPWAPGTGWLLCDLYFSDGRPVPFATRNLYASVLDRLAKRGYDFVAGLEVEFHIFKLENPKCRRSMPGQPGTPPEVSLLSHGYQYLTEQRYDQMEPVLEIIRRDVLALGLPLRSVEVEFGPSQCEFTFAPAKGLAPADNMVLFRSAVKQIARRHGFHATFMCRPKLAKCVRVRLASASVAGVARRRRERLHGEGWRRGAEPVRQSYLAGLLPARPRLDRVHDADHQRLQALPLLFAGAGSRDLGARQPRRHDPRARRRHDPATRLENRIGEPAANPYLYMASQILSGLDGVDRKLDPGPSADTPYETKAALLPKTLREAVYALQRRSVLPRGAGRGIRRLLRPHQERRDRAVSGRGVGLGAAGIF